MRSSSPCIATLSLALLLAAASPLACDRDAPPPDTTQPDASPTATQGHTTSAPAEDTPDATPTPPAETKPDQGEGDKGEPKPVEPPPRSGPPTRWIDLGATTAPRAWHAAARLKDGRVLIHGGETKDRPVASAELFDPSGQKFSAVAPSTRGYARHVLVVLAEGAVIAFGNDGGERFDPKANAWSPIAAAPIKFGMEHTATLLSDGRVLVAGGTSGPTLRAAPSRSAALYDPAADAWSKPIALRTARKAHTASLMPDGRVLLAGGYGANTRPLRDVEALDPVKASSATLGRMLVPRADHVALSLNSGGVLLLGGEDQYDYTVKEVEVWAPDATTPEEVGLLQPGRVGAMTALLPSGLVMITGGARGRLRRDPINVTVFFNPATPGGEWIDGNNMPTDRSWGTATVLTDGAVLLVGGLGGSGIAPGAHLLTW